MTKPRIGIIISSTRETRFGHRPAEWLLKLATARGDADYEIVDLRDYPMPFFDEAASARYVPPQNEVALRWGRKMAELDGYIIVAAEYNHGVTAVLKNALDHVYYDVNRKPVAFVGYGVVGAARSVEHLRMTAVELGMAPIKSAVHVTMEPFMGMLQGGKDFADYDYLGVAAVALFDELIWWTDTLRTGREADEQKKAA